MEEIAHVETRACQMEKIRCMQTRIDQYEVFDVTSRNQHRVTESANLEKEVAALRFCIARHVYRVSNDLTIIEAYPFT